MGGRGREIVRGSKRDRGRDRERKKKKKIKKKKIDWGSFKIEGASLLQHSRAV